MNLYTDDNPQTTLKGLGFKNKLKALQTITRVESYFDKMFKSQVIPGWTPHMFYLEHILKQNKKHLDIIKNKKCIVY